MPGRVVLLDNKDSFVWNLAQAVGSSPRAIGAGDGSAVDGHRAADDAVELEVVRTDRLSARSVDDLVSHADAVVLSPGPGRPRDAGFLLDAVEACAHHRVATLGVCLGHQAIGEAFGARLVRSRPCHGETSTVDHDRSGVLVRTPRRVGMARYHSLVLDRESLTTTPLVENAWTDEPGAGGTRLCMGVRHPDLPIHGVQFHPESFLCRAVGERLIADFLDLALGRPA